MNKKTTPQSGKITFSLNTKIYSKDIILKTCYVFIDRMYIYLDLDSKGNIIVNLESKEESYKIKREKLKGEFFNELLNNLLRSEIGTANQKIREYIVATALVSALPSNALSADETSDEINANWQSDPLGIAVPWEKKYGNKKK